MQNIVDQELPASLKKLEEASEAWPQHIRLVAALIQRCLAEFISPLLMIGLILSMGNYLLGGTIFQFSPAIPFIWVIVQCVAIDANLGIMIVRAVKEFHAEEYIKGAIYLLISGALLFVAAIIFNTEALESVVNHVVGTVIPIEWLTLIRSGAIVALVAINQLEGVSLRIQKLSKREREIPGNSTPKNQEEIDRKIPEVVGSELYSETSGNLLAVNPEQWQRLEEAYNRITTKGKTITWKGLQKESGVRNELVGPFMRWKTDQMRQRMHKQWEESMEEANRDYGKTASNGATAPTASQSGS